MNEAYETPAFLEAAASIWVSRLRMGVFFRATGTRGVMTLVALTGTTPKQSYPWVASVEILAFSPSASVSLLPACTLTLTPWALPSAIAPSRSAAQ